jgi:hypothetical protein
VSGEIVSKRQDVKKGRLMSTIHTNSDLTLCGPAYFSQPTKKRGKVGLETFFHFSNSSAIEVIGGLGLTFK